MLSSLRYFLSFIVVLASQTLPADSFKYNTYNNHGVLGLINTPSARFYEEGGFGVTVYDGTPDQKITITSSPYDWFEASFFYTNIQNRRYCDGDALFCDQDYKDKGFNLKLRLKEEGLLPALAIGINDIAGTGLYSSEYIVSSYGIGSIDFHFGLGWGALNGDESIKNPFAYIDNRFSNRPYGVEDKGGQFQPSRYFSNKNISPFYGISYAINNNILLKIEHDTTLTSDSEFGLNYAQIDYELPESKTSIGVEFSLNKNFTIALSQERDNYFSLRFIYKQEAASSKNDYKYKKIQKDDNDNKYGHLVKTLESNGIGVNRIVESANSIGLELTQFSHPNLDIVEDILMRAVGDTGIKKEIKADYRIADLRVTSSFDDDLNQNSKVIYKRQKARNFNTSNTVTIRPFIAGREGFFKLAVLAENNSEYVIRDNFFFSSNIKYSLVDNFEDLTIPPVDVYPAQVRSDVKEYLRNLDHVNIGRAQFDYHVTPLKNHHIMLTAGILEEMFMGYGMEYLYFDNNQNYALGFEVFEVQKRDYKMQFGALDYKNITGSANFYYKNYDIIPFDAKISYGEYLAGDTGLTFELSRTYLNGAEFGVFATFTDVTSEQFGEGTFDKGIFFSIPIYKNLLNYTWRPLTKDPGAKLNRKHTLHDLLVKFRPYNTSNSSDE